jgi:hypothetical protein
MMIRNGAPPKRLVGSLQLISFAILPKVCFPKILNHPLGVLQLRVDNT